MSDHNIVITSLDIMIDEPIKDKCYNYLYDSTIPMYKARSNNTSGWENYEDLIDHQSWYEVMKDVTSIVKKMNY